jgi:cytochrome b involved in lipid metabolism
MKKSLIILASVLLLVGAGCEDQLKDRFEDTTRSASETRDTNDDSQRDEVSSDDVQKEDGDRVKGESDDNKNEIEDEDEDENESDDDRPSTTTPTPAPTPSNGTSGTVKAYAMSEVAVHKDASSCWTVVNGSVYDLTSWIGKHPGGPVVITLLCGRDGSSEFSDQHGGQRRPEQELAGFKIGTLKK